jgi:hypothetical protein
MDQSINEIWLQFGYLNAKGNVTKTALKIPFHTQLKVDQEIPISILDKVYNFSCVREETVSNNSDTVDKIYVIATNHQ